MKILLINTCDEWKSQDSMSLIGVITYEQLKNSIIELVKNKIIEVTAVDVYEELEDGDGNELNISVLEDFIDGSDIRYLNNGIDYLYIQEVELGEINTDGCMI